MRLLMVIALSLLAVPLEAAPERRAPGRPAAAARKRATRRHAHRPGMDYDRLPIRVGEHPVRDIFATGLLTVKMPEHALADFGPNGAGMTWVGRAPDNLTFALPAVEEDYTRWTFYPFSDGRPTYAWGQDLALDYHLYQQFAPRARAVAESLRLQLQSEFPERIILPQRIVAVAFPRGGAVSYWHPDNQASVWDMRIIGVGPYGVAPSTQVVFDGAVHTAPNGFMTGILPDTIHRGLATPDQLRLMTAYDFKAPLRR